MTARNLSLYKTKLRDIAKETYLEQGWTLPEGFVDSAARDPRNYTLAEYQQAKRMIRDARDLKSMMAECWAASDSAAAFKHALDERGITLAKGDRRGHVAVTREGEVLAISRYTGKKAKEVRAKLGEPENLPSVEQAKTSAATSMSAAMTKHMVEARLEHKKAMAPLEARRRAMTEHHRTERAKMDAGQKTRWKEETRLRSEQLNSGLRGLWDHLTGRHAEMERKNIAEAQAAVRRDRDQRQLLIAAQLSERQELQTEIKATRDRQAELLRGLRTDRQAYDRKLTGKELDRSTENLRPRLEQAAQTAIPAEPSRLAKTFEQASQPTHQDRLQKLRENLTAEPRPPERGCEPER
ncbi:relaxase [Nisaea nitritireducens]|uniref:relaxase n=1 Tax=Nisaea nitritireducens TaxID=568392 RepID=UPI001866A74F|nr:relaxase [Nisaea nitritireducens]